MKKQSKRAQRRTRKAELILRTRERVRQLREWIAKMGRNSALGKARRILDSSRSGYDREALWNALRIVEGTPVSAPARVQTQTPAAQSISPAPDRYYLNFDILPAGTAGRSAVTGYYRRLREAGRCEEIDLGRFEKLDSLNPTKRYVGTKGWGGYIVYEFADLGKAVLECARVGNAAYVISGDWGEAVRHSKSYLRDSLRSRCTWIRHDGDWFTELQNVLGYKRRKHPLLPPGLRDARSRIPET